MRCEQITPYLPGYAGGDLRADTIRLVTEHVAGCSACRDETARLERVTAGLRALTAREADPPPFLLSSILEQTSERKGRRMVPPIVPAAIPPEMIRLVQDNRDALASAGAAAVVTAGAAYVLYRAMRRAPRRGPATA